LKTDISSQNLKIDISSVISWRHQFITDYKTKKN